MGHCTDLRRCPRGAGRSEFVSTGHVLRCHKVAPSAALDHLLDQRENEADYKRDLKTPVW